MLRDHSSIYDQHLSTLWFVDAEVEHRYVTDLYVRRGHHGLTLYPLIYGLSLFIVAVVAWTENMSDPWTHPSVIFALICVCISFVLWPLLFWIRRYRLRMYDTFYAVMASYSILSSILTHIWLLDRNSDNLMDLVAHGFLVLPIIRIRFTASVLSFILPTIGVAVFLCFRFSIVYTVWTALVVFPLALAYVLDMQSRTQFINVDRSELRLARLAEHTEKMESTLLAAFPDTALRQLLTRNENNISVFPDTVLIVMDVCGFTAWTFHSTPLEIVNTMSVMFDALDAAAAKWGVEKMYTAGDSYLGAIFGPVLTNDDDDDEDVFTTGRRVLRGVQFGLAAAHVSKQHRLELLNRVGVHIGDVHAGFVGCAPPVFDLFGAALSETRLLEVNGAPSCVHTSRVALTLSEGCGFGHGVEVFGTEHSVLLSDWVWRRESLLLSLQAQQIPLSSVDKQTICDNLRRLDLQQQKQQQRRATMTSCCSSPYYYEAHNDDAHDDDNDVVKLPHLERASAFGTLQNQNINLDRHPYFRTFKDPIIEQCFVEYTQREALYEHMLCVVCFFLALAAPALFVARVCGDSWDRVVCSGALIVMLIYYVFLQMEMQPLSRLFAFACAINACSVALATFSEDCGLSKDDWDWLLNAKSIVSLLRYFSWLPMFTSPRWARVLALLFGIVIQFVLEAQIQILFFGEDLVIPSFDVALPSATTLIAAFFIDEALRRGFIARARVEDALRTSGTYARHTRATLHMMLPAPVADVVLRRETYNVISMPRPTRRASSRVSIIDVAAEGNDETVIEYTHLVVANVQLSLDDSETTVMSLLNEVERIALSHHGITKVRSTGTSMLFVSDMELTNTADVSESTHRMCTGVLDIVRTIGTTTTRHGDVRICCGIHVGPCFGAVLGTHGLSFDVYGETVNTAITIASSCTGSGVRLSPVIVDCLGAAPAGTRLGPNSSLKIKGKGSIQVYTLEFDEY